MRILFNIAKLLALVLLIIIIAFIVECIFGYNLKEAFIFIIKTPQYFLLFAAIYAAIRALRIYIRNTLTQRHRSEVKATLGIMLWLRDKGLENRANHQIVFKYLDDIYKGIDIVFNDTEAIVWSGSENLFEYKTSLLDKIEGIYLLAFYDLESKKTKNPYITNKKRDKIRQKITALIAELEQTSGIIEQAYASSPKIFQFWFSFNFSKEFLKLRT